ncbi:MAG: D-lyxose/D-mannose family sugar isomerase [Victivallis sp.]
MAFSRSGTSRLPPFRSTEGRLGETPGRGGGDVGPRVSAGTSRDWAKGVRTLRADAFHAANGKAGSAKYPKPYAEKIMMVRENQITLRHFHWHKREDIIVRSSGDLGRRGQPGALGRPSSHWSHSKWNAAANGIPGDRLVLDSSKTVCSSRFTLIATPSRYQAPRWSANVAVNDDANDDCFSTTRSASTEEASRSSSGRLPAATEGAARMRDGILAAGNWIADRVGVDVCSILAEERAPGGGTRRTFSSTLPPWYPVRGRENSEDAEQPAG